MKQKLLLITCLFLGTIAVSKAQSFNWVKSTGNIGQDKGEAVALDNSGNIYTTGTFGGIYDVDPGSGTFDLYSKGGLDVFVRKSDSFGRFQWAHRIGGTEYDYVSSISVDNLGNTYVIGKFLGKVDFDPSQDTTWLDANVFYHVFVVKLDPSGNFLWAKDLGRSFNQLSNTEEMSLAVDAIGNIFTIRQLHPSGDEMRIEKWDPSGNLIWMKPIQGDDYLFGQALKLDANANLYITGGFSGTTDFDPGVGVQNLTSLGSSDAFISKLDSAGNLIWAKQIGESGTTNIGRSIAIDDVGNVYTVGDNGGADMDPGPGVANIPWGGYFISKLTPSGDYIWGTWIGNSTNNSLFNDLEIDDNNDLYLTGWFFETTDFEPGGGATNLVAVGNSDIFIVKLDSSASLISANQIGGVGYDSGNDIVSDNQGNVYLTGFFEETVDFDYGAPEVELTSNGNRDEFLLKISDCITSWSTDTVDAVGSYTWIDGNTYTTNNITATHVLPNAAGCDSLVTLNLSIYNNTSATTWAKQISGDYNQKSNSIVADDLGYVYTTGSFNDLTDFDPNAGTFNITSVQYDDIFIFKQDPSGNLVWAKQMGGTYSESGSSIVLDSDNNIYITGQFGETVDFDPGVGVFNLTAVANNDVFVSKLDSSGSFIWAKQIGGTGNATGASLTLGPAGDIHLTGLFDGEIDFDPGVGIFNLTSNASADIYVCKLNSSGNFIWAKHMGGTSNDSGLSIKVDASGNVYTTGYFDQIADFNPGPPVVNLITYGSKDIFISKLDASGNYVWAKQMGSYNNNTGYGITLDNMNNVYVVGSCSSTPTYQFDVDPGPGTIYLNTLATGFIAKLDDGGNLIWAKEIGEEGTTLPYAVATDAYNNVYATGAFFGTTDFNPGPAVMNSFSAGQEDVFIVKFDSSGNYKWVEQMGGTEKDNGRSIFIDQANFVYTTGEFRGTSDYDTGAGVITLTCVGTAGNTDAFVHKMSQCTPTTATDTVVACDSYTWIDGNTYTSSANNIGYILTDYAGCDSVVTLNLTINNSTTSMDTIVVCDSYTWIDGITYTSSDTLAVYSSTNIDGCNHLTRLNLTIDSSTTSIDTQVACDSYTWIDGNTYTANNTIATHILSNAVGCDSTVTLNLTINNSTTGTDTQVACGSYTWIDGNTYTSNNTTATHILTNAVGCDSIVTLNLTINNSTIGTDTQVACDSYTWVDGNTYTSSNTTATFTYSGGASNGCDSIVTLNLTINNSESGIDIQQACSSYTWIDGNTYTSSNTTATHTIVGGALNGCDSTVTLNLTISGTINGADTQVACGSYTWIDGNTYTVNNSTATHLIVGGSSNGCDSLVTLNLTINNSTSGTDTQVACDSYTWIDGNTYTSNNNTATHTIIGGAASGCDSLVTLNLTINNCGGPASCSELFFSEYIEGSGNDKALEIYNPTSGAIDLSTYQVNRYSNGSTGIGASLNLTGSLNSGETYVIVNPNASAGLLALADITSNVCTFNGDDAIELVNGVSSIDIIGEIGTDPGTNWAVGAGATADYTLVRSDTVSKGQLGWIVSQNEWVVYPQNDFTHLGSHISTAGCFSCTTVYGTDVQLICEDEFTWIDGNTYFSNNNSATYTLVGGSANGCDSIVTLNLTFDANITPSYYSYIDPTDSLNLIIVNTSTGNIVNYLWDFGDGNTSTNPYPQHTYAAQGNYTICLTISDANCTKTFCDTTNVLKSGGIISIEVIPPVATNVIDNNNNLEKEVLVYPNPTKGRLNIELNSTYTKLKVNVKNALGQLVSSNFYKSAHNIVLDIKGDKGIYFVEIFSEEYQLEIIKVLKQ